MLNPGSVGASLYSVGKAQFVILYQNGEEWGHQFINLDYDKKKSDKGNGSIGALGCGTVLVSGDKIRDACRGDFPWNGIEQGNGALQGRNREMRLVQYPRNILGRSRPGAFRKLKFVAK